MEKRLGNLERKQLEIFKSRKKNLEIGRNRLCRPQLHLLFWPFGPGQELAAVSLRNSRRFGLLTEIRRILTFCGEEETSRGCGLALIRCTALNILMMWLSQQIQAAAMKNITNLVKFHSEEDAMEASVWCASQLFWSCWSIVCVHCSWESIVAWPQWGEGAFTLRAASASNIAAVLPSLS